MVGRRRGSGLPATALAGGGAVWCDFFPLHATVGFFPTQQTLAGRSWREEGGGGVRFAAGGGQGHPQLDGRRAQDRVAPCLAGRPAGGGQGCRKRGGF